MFSAPHFFLLLGIGTVFFLNTLPTSQMSQERRTTFRWTSLKMCNLDSCPNLKKNIFPYFQHRERNLNFAISDDIHHCKCLIYALDINFFLKEFEYWLQWWPLKVCFAYLTQQWYLPVFSEKLSIFKTTEIWMFAFSRHHCNQNSSSLGEKCVY